MSGWRFKYSRYYPRIDKTDPKTWFCPKHKHEFLIRADNSIYANRSYCPMCMFEEFKKRMQAKLGNRFPNPEKRWRGTQEWLKRTKM